MCRAYLHLVQETLDFRERVHYYLSMSVTYFYTCLLSVPRGFSTNKSFGTVKQHFDDAVWDFQNETSNSFQIQIKSIQGIDGDSYENKIVKPSQTRGDGHVWGSLPCNSCMEIVCGDQWLNLIIQCSIY